MGCHSCNDGFVSGVERQLSRLTSRKPFKVRRSYAAVTEWCYPVGTCVLLVTREHQEIVCPSAGDFGHPHL